MPKNNNYAPDWYEIDDNAYDWSVKLFQSVKKILSVNLKLHAENQVEQGDIFLFNHFSRFETFIPQYLIHEKTGAYSCAIASGEFFKHDTALAKYLRNVGVFPHNHERLFPILAGHIFRGRKVIIFPEGGMVKDRSVLDNKGHYSIFSRSSGQRRKHHTGAAVLAQGIEAFKAAIRNAYTDKRTDLLLQWQAQLQLDNLEQLLMTAIKPTLIIPANITFYPIRASENMLFKGAEFFSGNLSLRQTEELLVEGNIILKDTDMDVRMGKPIDPYHVWCRWNRYLLDLVATEFTTLDDVFALGNNPKNFKQRILGGYFKYNAGATRDQYMVDIYSNVTINLSHLASTLIMHYIAKGQHEINKVLFYNTLYIAIKLLQNNASINLHRSLLNPEQYDDLITCQNQRFEHFICVSESTGLISRQTDSIQFLAKLHQEHDFDSIRMENLIAVYDNEAAPIKAVLSTLLKAHKMAECVKQGELAMWLVDDQIRTFQRSKQTYQQTRYNDINKTETASGNAEPFFLRPKKANGYGVLLIHGLLASPAELIGFGHYLVKLGYTVLGVRLAGHGTSPYELKENSWEDWYVSLQKQFRILTLLCDRCFVCGFSTGALLGLKLAVEQPEKIISVISVAVPFKFNDQALMLVPLIHGTNKLINWVSSFEGVKPFIENDPEHPAVNYRNTPIRALYELRRLVQDMEQTLTKIEQPNLFIFADQDPIVAIESADLMMQKISAEDKRLVIIDSDWHGILMDNIADIWQLISDYLREHQGTSKISDISKNCLSEQTN